MWMWGRCPHLRRVSRPACAGLSLSDAGPSIFFNRCSQPSLDRIVDNVFPNAAKFFPIPLQPIVTFILPKPLPGASQQLVGLSGTVALQPAQETRCVAMRSKEQVNVIGHNHPRVHIAIRPGAMLNATAEQPGNLGPLQIAGSEARRIQQPVHRHKRLPGCHTFLWELAPNGQTTEKPKGNEKRLSNRIDMWQTSV